MSKITGIFPFERREPVGAGMHPFQIPSLATPRIKSAAAIACALKLELVHDLASLAHEWKALEVAGDCTPFQTFAWLDNWQRHIGKRRGTIPAIVFGRGGDRQVLIIMPLAIETLCGLRRLTWLGSQMGDYNAPLLAKDFSTHPAADNFTSVWHSVRALLRTQNGLRLDVIDLQKMPEMIGEQKNPFLQLDVSSNRSAAYITALGKNWNEYYAAKRSAATRKTNRRKQRQLEEHGKLHFAEIDGPAEAVRLLETLMEQKAQFLARIGAENIFERPGYPEFYKAIVASQLRAGLMMSRLDVGDKVGAISVGLKHRGRYYLFLSSYHPGEIARFGPGTTLLHELLRHCIETGIAHFDFTIGDEPYKLDWAETKILLYDHVTAATALGATAVLKRRLANGIVRSLKHRTGLWNVLKRIRLIAINRQRFAPEREPD